MPSTPLVLAAPVRLNYFDGRLLTAEDFKREQTYHLEARRRLNLLALGVGVVSGLRVSSTGSEVSVSPGIAIDCLGREVIVPEPVELPLGPARSGVRPVMLLAYAEEAVEPMPVSDNTTRFGAVRETYRLWLSSARPPAGDPQGALVIGVVKRARRSARRRPARSRH